MVTRNEKDATGRVMRARYESIRSERARIDAEFDAREAALIREWHDAGFSYTEIGAELGVTRQYVNRLAHR